MQVEAEWDEDNAEWDGDPDPRLGASWGYTRHELLPNQTIGRWFPLNYVHQACVKYPVPGFTIEEGSVIDCKQALAPLLNDGESTINVTDIIGKEPDYSAPPEDIVSGDGILPPEI